MQSRTGAIFGQHYIGNINNLKTCKRCLFFCQQQYQYKLHKLFVLFSLLRINLICCPIITPLFWDIGNKELRIFFYLGIIFWSNNDLH